MLVAAEPVLLPLEFVCEFEELAGASRKSCVGNLTLLDHVKQVVRKLVRVN